MRGKTAYLDGLRGIAAFVVVLHHIACGFLPAAVFGTLAANHTLLESLLYLTPLSLLIAGNFSVAIFFVLSGYVLSIKFFSKNDNSTPASGAVRRYFRLMPLVTVTLVTAYVLIKLGLLFNTQAAAITGSGWLVSSWTSHPHLLVVIKTALYDTFITGNNVGAYNNVLWTMNLEFIGSFIVFGILAIFGRLNRRWLIYFVLILLSWKTYYLAFIAGLILADVSVNIRQFKLSRRVAVALICIGLLLGSYPSPSATHTLIGDIVEIFISPTLAYSLLHVVGAISLVLSTLHLEPVQRLLEAKPAQYLGKISFSLYSIHLLVLGSVGSYIFIHVTSHLGYITGIAIMATAVLGVSLLAAMWLNRYIDAPAVRYSSLLYQVIFVKGDTLKILRLNLRSKFRHHGNQLFQIANKPVFKRP